MSAVRVCADPGGVLKSTSSRQAGDAARRSHPRCSGVGHSLLLRPQVPLEPHKPGGVLPPHRHTIVSVRFSTSMPPHEPTLWRHESRKNMAKSILWRCGGKIAPLLEREVSLEGATVGARGRSAKPT